MQLALKTPHKSIELDDLRQKLLSEYQTIANSLSINHVSRGVSYTSPVNFKESLASKRHRWFPYKEGFSPTFVKNFLNKNMNGQKGIVFDPFSGVGTTALVAGELGFKAIGFDVSPLTIFIARTKALSFDKAQRNHLRQELKCFSDSPLKERSDPPSNNTVSSYFEDTYLSALLRVKWYIANISDDKIQNLFKLAFLVALEEFSTHRKAGNGVKKKTRLMYRATVSPALEQIKTFIFSMLSTYLEDLETSDLVEEPKFFTRSCLDTSSYADVAEIGCVITSPPYANCFDYSKIYMRELWLGDFFQSIEDQRAFRKASMRSHVHASWPERFKYLGNTLVDGTIREILERQNLWSTKIPEMLSGYFKDTARLLEILSEKMPTGARAGFVVSNSFYGGIPIATDLLIAEISRSLRFKPIGIEVYRNIIPSSQQYGLVVNKELMRESLVILEKI